MIIEEFKDIQIAYMRRIGKYGAKNKQLMENFKAYLKANNLFNNDTAILGIALDDPMQTPAKQQRYDVGVIVTNKVQLRELPTRGITNGRYAIFEIAHTAEAVANFWNNTPALTANLPIDSTKPIIERYAYPKIAQHLCEFCVPLQ